MRCVSAKLCLAASTDFKSPGLNAGALSCTEVTLMPEQIREALGYATETLKTCAPIYRDGVKRWIDQLLDMVNRR